MRTSQEIITLLGDIQEIGNFVDYQNQIEQEKDQLLEELSQLQKEDCEIYLELQESENQNVQLALQNKKLRELEFQLRNNYNQSQNSKRPIQQILSIQNSTKDKIEILQITAENIIFQIKCNQNTVNIVMDVQNNFIKQIEDDKTKQILLDVDQGIIDDGLNKLWQESQPFQSIFLFDLFCSDLLEQ